MKQTILLLLVLGTALAFPESQKTIPSFKYDDVYSALNQESSGESILRQVIKASKDVGSFLITDPPSKADYSDALKSLKSGAPSCFKLPSDKIVSLLVSPSVLRQTSATSSKNPTGSDHPECIQKETEMISITLDEVQNLVNQLIAKVAGNDAFTLLPDSPSASPLAGSPHLDHVHVYTSMPEAGVEPTASLHTDNGLFLLATPSQEAPLHVQDPFGRMLTTFDPKENGIIVLFGRGIDQWLLKDSALTGGIFRAAPHTVPPMSGDRRRVIFARMIVADKQALPVSGKNVTFGDFFMMQETHESDLCPGAYQTDSSAAHLWRVARDSMCDEGYDYCWMGCMPLDPACPADQQLCYNNQGKRCCGEGETSADGCLDMDGFCAWHCS